MDTLFNRVLPWSGGHFHYNSDIRRFYDSFREYRIASVNNRFIELDQLEEFRLTRFIRDPRDLVVSGYFYHLKGREAWCNLPNPTERDWFFANGVVPEGLRQNGSSYTTYLRSLSEEDGLLAELEFRFEHFASMAKWPENHPAILTLRYEDVIQDEVGAFMAMFDHYEFGSLERRLGLWLVERFSLARRLQEDQHIRNPAVGQWRQHFTPRVRNAFETQWRSLIDRLGYAAE
ncbi:MAG: sulfotransferase domain-containing protein [Pseudomonadota bacterium]